MKTLVRCISWCALLLLGCRADPDGNGPAGAEASGGATGSAGTAGSAPSAGGTGSATPPGTSGTSGISGAGPGAPPIDNDDPQCGAPPSIALMSPAEAAQVAPGAVALEVNTAADPIEASSNVTFYLRRTHDPDFTMVVMPDTQNYVVDAYNQQHFYRQTQWTMERREAENIVSVIHNGDLINRPEMTFEWDWAEDAMSTLEEPFPDHPAGLPYIIAIGNHDQQPMSAVGGAHEFNARFGVNRFSGRPYYGGHFGQRNDHWYIKFTAGSLKFLVLTMEYGAVPSDVQQWALDVIRSHPDHRVIINMHQLINTGGNWTGAGHTIYELLKAEPNVELMTCGHHPGEGRRSDTFEGHTIHTMLADWQHLDQGGQGRMRIWRFSPANGTLFVRSYSPSFDEEYTSDQSRFTLPYDMSDAVPDFAPVAVVGDASGNVTATTAELDPETEYQWYAEATDACGQVTTTEVRRFSTM